MSCEQVREQISLMLDGLLTSPECQTVQAHARSCRECDARLEFMQNLRADIRSMAKPAVPSSLTTQLRVTASHEYARRMARVNLSALLRGWGGNIRLAFDNLMRPFAVPVTGGLFTALLLFSILPWCPSFQHSTAYETPILDRWLTDPKGEIVGATYGLHVEPGDATISGNETALVLLIDERGHVEGYYLSGGELTDEMKSVILLSRFTPATIYGQPTWGLKQVVFQHASPRRRLRS
jgi:hypothetical protein